MYHPNTRLFGNLDKQEFLKCYAMSIKIIPKNSGLSLCTKMSFQVGDWGSNPDRSSEFLFGVSSPFGRLCDFDSSFRCHIDATQW